jgi:lipid A oxidase
MLSRTTTTSAVGALIVGALLPLPHSAQASEFSLGVYGGWNGSFNSDVRFTDPDTDWTVNSVPWQGLSFLGDGGAPYYGVRGTWWSDQNWGVMLDFTHAKVRADPNATVNYGGVLDGGNNSGSGPVSGLFDLLEFTDGINILTINGMYRFRPVGHFRPYVGAGIGINVPHVEVESPGGSPFPRTFAYEYGGFAAQALAGVEVPVGEHFSLFGEYKLSWAGVNAPMEGGYRIHTDIITNHILAGVSVRFGNPPPPPPP